MKKTLVIACVMAVALAVVGLHVYSRYHTAETMQITVRELSNNEYPEDPALRSVNYGKYEGRELKLVQRDATHFDFIFESNNPHVAKVVFRDIDVSMMTPSLPEWTKQDEGLKRIALTDRQWNRQQVRFEPGSQNIEIFGGDGFEKNNIFSAELAKNCLNAGLWEVLLFSKENDNKVIYYHGWFTFPLGHYKNLFEHNTGLAYLGYWHFLEHWFDPAGTVVDVSALREVVSEHIPTTVFDPTEKMVSFGEQLAKRRTTIANNILQWSDFYAAKGENIRFASFIPPGRYSVDHQWQNQYWKIDKFDQAILRDIRSPGDQRTLQELELSFHSSVDGSKSRFFVSGVDMKALPQLPISDYPKGLYMPMGIGVPPFYQAYADLQLKPLERSPFFSVLLDDKNQWIDHHSLALDGAVMHRDLNNPDLLHVYLLSYERHSLIGHFVVSLAE